MKWYKRIVTWFIFPLDNPNLTPSVLWVIIFTISIPILFIISSCLGAKDWWFEHKAKRLIFKKEYKEYIKNL